MKQISKNSQFGCGLQPAHMVGLLVIANQHVAVNAFRPYTARHTMGLGREAGLTY